MHAGGGGVLGVEGSVYRDDSGAEGAENGDEVEGGSGSEEGSGAGSDGDSDTSEGSSVESLASEERKCVSPPFIPSCWF